MSVTVINPISATLTPTSTTVGVTATLLPATALAGRRSVVVHNSGSVTVFLGPSSVTTANGLPIAPNEKISLDINASVLLYGIVSSGSADVRTLEGA